MSKDVQDIEQKVLLFLKKILPQCGHTEPHILAAVSGGPDSIVLLTALARLRSSVHFFLSAITVNHNIRPTEESDGDATFAQSYCDSLGVACMVAVIPPGQIQQLACSDRGIEDAARQLRYEAFERESARIGADFIALGHNQNDQLETVVMRFLQGGGAGSLGGIKQVRLPYIRPLLDCSRAEIESYLNAHSLEYRFDATNADESYLRNRLRKSLLPRLSILVPGWQKSVLTLAEKMQDDEDFIQRSAADIPIAVRYAKDKTALYVEFCRNDVISLAPAVLLRFLQRVCILLQAEHRLSYRHFVRMRDAIIAGRNVAGSGVFLCRSGSRFFMGKDIVQSYKTGYLVKVSENAVIATAYFTVRCNRETLPCGEAETAYPSQCVLQLMSGDNVFVRSVLAEDAVQFSNGKTLSAKSFFAKEHIPVFLRKEIPIIVCNGFPVCFAGSVFGFTDVCNETFCRTVDAESFPEPFYISFSF